MPALKLALWQNKETMEKIKPVQNPKRRRTMWLDDMLWDRMALAAETDARTISEWTRRAILAALTPR